MRENLKRNNGITLIALVVTIVVLLILAAVSISMLTGENGIITQAQNSKEESEIGKEKEMVSLAVSSLKGQGYVNGENMLTSENLQKEMDDLAGKDKTLVTGTTILTVLFKETNREYSVNADGEFVEPIDYSTIYTYTEDGYITGVKSEYLTHIVAKSLNKRYASIKNIKIAEIQHMALVEELNGTLKIPNKIEETKIKGIESKAFQGIINLKEVIIDNGIEEIKDYAFEACNELYEITIPFSVQYIASNTFNSCYRLSYIFVEKEKGSLENEPWGANNANIYYIGKEKFIKNYLSSKDEQELEEIILKDGMYIGTFEEFLAEDGITREDLKKQASDNSMTYKEYLKSYIIERGNWIEIEYQASLLGILDKSVEELEEIFVEKVKESGAEEQIGEFNTFDELLEKTNMTRQEFEETYKLQGYRTEEDFLKMYIVMIEEELNNS